MSTDINDIIKALPKERLKRIKEKAAKDIEEHKESNKHIGSSFDGYLEEEGLLDECSQEAIEKLRKMLDDARQSGISDKSMDDIKKEAIEQLRKEGKIK
jgi:hypothetical protein